MTKYIATFHYLSQDMPHRSHAEQVSIACKAGVNWVQYRCLTKSHKELIKEINEIAIICDDWGATLIVTDHHHLLDKTDVQGVHMEDMSMDLSLIRNQIGEEKTLGASANSFEDIRRINLFGVADYIGCGPFNLTQTKINNYPLLGTESYVNILNQMAANDINIPLLAVGGITVKDVKKLLETGIHGIAVSSSVNLDKDPPSVIKEFRSYFI